MNVRQIAGAKAQKFGQAFEWIFLRACKGIAVSRMPDGCRVVGKNRLLRVKTPFDWILTYGGKSAFIDTKTVADDRFPAALIAEHQLDALCRHQDAGATAGYVVQMRSIDRVYFVHANSLKVAFHNRKAIHWNQMSIDLGPTATFSPIPIFNLI